MPDSSRLEAELRRLYPESWVRHHLDSFSPAYFAAFSPEEVAQHLELVRALDDEQLVIPLVWRAGPELENTSGVPFDADLWWVEVVGYDVFQFLSTLCNLLTVYGLAIVKGHVFTSQPPPPETRADAAPGMAARTPPFRPGPGRGQPPRFPRGKKGAKAAKEPDRRRKVVDRFLVRRARPDGPPPDWGGFEREFQDLARLLREGQHDEVHHRLIGRLAAALGHPARDQPALEPLELTIDPSADPSATVVRIATRDSDGFLGLTASALALCGIMITQAEIHTEPDGRVDDTLWVTDRGGAKITGEPALRQLRLSLILIEHFSSRLHRAANPEAALVHFSRFATETMARPAWAEEFAALDRPEVLDALVRVFGESDFLWEDYLQARPEELLPMIAHPTEWRRRDRAELAGELKRALAEIESDSSFESEAAEVLRRFKDRTVFRASVRAILEPDADAAPHTLADELSEAAEVLLEAAWTVAARRHADFLPRGPDGREIAAALFALGKFGGRELGFGSDLELMLVYDDHATADSARATSAGNPFETFLASLRRLLAVRQGTTFALDFRLRPYGRAGTPATALSTFADYYRDGGAAWSYERQALVKLRTIAGDAALAARVEALRDAYVYGPEPFDLEGYRRMRGLQVEQRVQPGRINAKFSPGALVDIEYFVQALQIAHGGRDPSLRTPSTERAITALESSGRLDPGVAARLRGGYRFFRSLIDALRVVRGHAQDLTVPPAGSDDFVLLARRMRRADPAALARALKRRLSEIQGLSARLEEFLDGPAPF